MALAPWLQPGERPGKYLRPTQPFQRLSAAFPTSLRTGLGFLPLRPATAGGSRRERFPRIRNPRCAPLNQRLAGDLVECGGNPAPSGSDTALAEDDQPRTKAPSPLHSAGALHRTHDNRSIQVHGEGRPVLSANSLPADVQAIK